MLHRLGLERFEARCDGCLACTPIFDAGEESTRDSLVADLAWELDANGTTYCLECSRKRREVKPSRPGRRRSRRR